MDYLFYIIRVPWFATYKFTLEKKLETVKKINPCKYMNFEDNHTIFSLGTDVDKKT